MRALLGFVFTFIVLFGINRSEQAYAVGPRSFTAEEAQGAFDTVENYLRAQHTVRVVISRAPGFGHQMAAIRAMKRFRELGFQGTFEIIYSIEAIKQLKVLIPGFDGSRPETVQEIRSNQLGQLRLVSSARALYLTKKKVGLGFSAADDATFGVRLREILNVQTAINFQPMGWTGRASDHQIVLKEREVSLRRLIRLQVHNDPIQEDAVEGIIREELKGPIYETKQPGVLSMLQATEQIDILPAYSQFLERYGPSVFEYLVTALLEAKQIAPERFAKPIIIPMLSDIDTGIRNKIARSLPVGVESINVQQIGRLQAALKGQGAPITLVHVGALPPGAFEAVVSQATLPTLLEGKNLINMMKSAGKPFLNFSGSDVEVVIDPTDSDLQNLVRDSYVALAPSNKPVIQLEPQRQQLVRFLIEARDPNSNLSRMFAAHRIDRYSTNEQIFQGLLLAIEAINEDKAAAEAKMNPVLKAAAGMCRLILSQ